MLYMAVEPTEPGLLYDLLLCYRSSIQFLQPVQDMVGSVQGCWGFNVQIYLNIDKTCSYVDQESFLIKKII